MFNKKLLRNSNFMLLIVGRFVSIFGTYIQNFSLSLYVLHKTGDAALFASTIAVSFIPRIILGPFAGVLADKFNKKKIMVTLDFISGGVIAIYSLIFFFKGEFSIFDIYVIQITLSLLNVMFAPASMGVLPVIIEKSERKNANSLNSFLSSGLEFITPLIAGFTYSFGLLPIMMFNSLSFVISGISEIFIKLPVSKRGKSKLDVKSLLVDLKEGVVILGKDRSILGLIFIGCGLNLLIGPLFSIAFPYILKTQLLVDDRTFGIVLSIMISAMVISPFIASNILKKVSINTLLKKIYLLIIIMTIACGGIFLGTSNFLVLIISLTIFGFLVAGLINILGICLVGSFQDIVPEEYYGRIGALFNSSMDIATPLGQLLIGFILAGGNSASLFIITGILLSTYLIVFRWLTKENKNKYRSV
ncbi:MFS transporter [Fusobacteria bacterium ZRK30]|nr:MFS transporter [Fusobacteria bacterium ZRK30]